jgi:hypothetical protein
MSIVFQQITTVSSTGPLTPIAVALVTGCWVLRVTVTNLSGGYEQPAILVAVQDSCDGFVNDIVTQCTFAVTGDVVPRAPAPAEFAGKHDKEVRKG